MLAVHSLHFDRDVPDSGTIPLWDPVTDTRLGERPEWILGQRDEPVAYVRGAVPSVRVTLRVDALAPASFRLSAFGPSLSLEDGERTPLRWLGPRVVNLEGTHGTYTLPEPVPFNVPLPGRIGQHSLALRWCAEWTDADGTAHQFHLGDSRHTVCTTGAPEGTVAGAYVPLVLWSSRWCAGLEGRKALCDAILRGLPETGLRYGPHAWTVRDMLLAGGGMCGAWYQLFQQLAGLQGVTVEGRTLHLVPASETSPRWEAMVTEAPGINQPEPYAQTRFHGRFNDCARYPFSPDEPVELLGRQASRYLFLAGPDDGHCVNFLEDGGRLYLYDPSFHTEAVALDMPLPRPEGPPLILSPEVPFRRDYLHAAMPYLMGTLRANGTLWEVDLERNAFGITVRTEQVPELGILWTR